MLRDIKVGVAFGGKTAQKKVEQYLSRLEEAGLGDKARSLLEGRLLTDVHALLEEHGAQQPPVSEFIRRYVELAGRAEKIGFFTKWLDRYGAPLRARDGGPRMMAEGVRKYIEANFRDPELSVASIAEAFHVGHAYLSRLYRKEYGQTCIEYITSLRIDYARSLVENTDIRHGDIAEEVGYASVYYFSIQFKKMMGETPGEYRRRRRSENENPHDTEG
jgi:AraC-like DNA-binding protein